LPQIDSQDDCTSVVKECVQTIDCEEKRGIGYRCIDGKCVKKDDPMILYIIIIGVAIILIIVAIIIWVSRKKRNDVNIGGFGL
jgi:hypothetical protein